MRIALMAIALILLATLTETVEAGPLTEQQARLKAAQWLRGPGFSADPSVRGPEADRSIPEILEHIRDALLVVRGNTGYCGAILEPTWILIFNHEASSWNGGYPMMINARTGKVLDCRS